MAQEHRQRQQVLQAERGSARRHRYERIRWPYVGPGRRQGPYPALAVVEEHPVLSPRVLVAEELQLLAMQRVEGVDYPENLSCINRIPCS